MPRPLDDLRAIFRAEHAGSVPAEARAVAEEIRNRHDPAVIAVLFYGSCLRKQQLEGSVLDFYAVVETYRDAYRSLLLATANRILPPNVFLLTVGSGDAQVHAKYAVISQRDFRSGVEGRTLNSIVWARFCQPARVVWARDQAARDFVASAAAEAAVTMLRTALALGDDDSEHPVDAEALWQRGFRATYATELRTERPETISELYAAAPARYERVTDLVLRELDSRGEVAIAAGGGGEPLRLLRRSGRLLALARRWRRRTPIAKFVYLIRLVKSALTFGDWLPYALFKLGRHTGVTIEPTPLQRRYPLIFGWPVFFKLLRSRKLR